MAGAVLVGCSGGDVSSNDVKSKEQQIADASHKLNGNQEQEQRSH
jgi:hypothetical protein